MKKNIWKLLGIIALAAVIGFGLAGCKGEVPPPSADVIPVEYRNTTWNLVPFAGIDMMYPDGYAVKLELRTSDFTATLKNGNTEDWFILTDAGVEDGWHAFAIVPSPSDLVSGVGIYFKVDGTNLHYDIIPNADNFEMIIWEKQQ
jgi:hypothetical protein